MARPKCLMRDFTNLNRIHKTHRTNVWWTMKVFLLHWLRRVLYGPFNKTFQTSSVSLNIYSIWSTYIQHICCSHESYQGFIISLYPHRINIHELNPDTLALLAGAYYANVLCSVMFPAYFLFNNLKDGYISNILLILDRCRCSLAAMPPVKY